MRPATERPIFAWVLLALAIVLHVALLWRFGAHWIDLDHDSTISYLAATGHQGEYERLATDAWIPARAIHRLFHVDEHLPFWRIGHDLARHDSHPPLYFWLLHVQFLVTGVTPWAFIVLNGLLGVAVLLVLYWIGNRMWDAETGAGAALLWSTSYGALMTASTAGPYVLLALCSLVLVRLALSVHMRGGRTTLGRAALLALVMLAGFLTHYQFPLVLVVVATVLVVVTRGARKRRWAQLGVLALVAFGAFALFHPEFVLSLERQRRQAQPFTWSDFVPRLRTFVVGLEDLARPAHARPWLKWVSILLVVWMGLRAYLGGAATRLVEFGRRVRGISPPARLLLWITLSLVVLQAVLYLGHVSPAHAAGGRYNAVVWPLFVLLIAGAVRALNPMRGALALLAIAVLPLTYQLAAELDDGQRAFARSSALQALESAHVVVADHSRRGVLPRAVLHVSETRPLWIVRGPSDVDSLLAKLRTRAIPVTFLLHAELGDPRVTRALAAARVPGDSAVTAGTLPAGTEVVVWSPRR